MSVNNIIPSSVEAVRFLSSEKSSKGGTYSNLKAPPSKLHNATIPLKFLEYAFKNKDSGLHSWLMGLGTPDMLLPEGLSLKESVEVLLKAITGQIPKTHGPEQKNLINVELQLNNQSKLNQDLWDQQYIQRAA